MRKYPVGRYFLRFKTASGDGAVAEAYIYDGWESEPTSKSTFSGSGVQYIQINTR